MDHKLLIVYINWEFALGTFPLPFFQARPAEYVPTGGAVHPGLTEGSIRPDVKRTTLINNF